MIDGVFLPAGARTPERALAIDGSSPGAAATYSHWRGAPPTPLELRADSSTAILANAARDPGRWLADFACACNDHVDADGVLAAAIACAPELGVAHRDVLIGAAEAGDFCAWPGDEPFLLMLTLHQHIRAQRGAGSGWEARVYRGIAAALPGLIAASRRRDTERDAQVASITDARRRLAQRDGFAVDAAPGLTTISWSERLGLGGDDQLAVHQPEDLPAWACDAVAGPRDFQLLAMAVAGGTVYRLDAPRHSWALTVTRPWVAWPDLSTLCAQLQAEEGGACRWVARPEAARLGFVCQLASCDADRRSAPSRLPLAMVRAACAGVLATATPPAPCRP